MLSRKTSSSKRFSLKGCQFLLLIGLSATVTMCLTAGACSSVEVNGIESAGNPAVSSVTGAPDAVHSPCGTPAVSQRDGSPLPIEYQHTATEVFVAACNHNYLQLQQLMADPFIYGDKQSGSPAFVVGTLRRAYPDNSVFDNLARMMTTPPYFEQDGLHYNYHASIAIFSRLYTEKSWSEYSYDPYDTTSDNSVGTVD